MPNSVVIRSGLPNDFKFLAKIHVESLPQDLLPRLGENFLKRVFFPTVSKSRKNFILVAEENKNISGFVIFSSDSSLLIDQLKKNKLGIAFSLLRNLLKDPWLALALLRTSQTQELPKENFDLKNIPELFVIAVNPNSRSQGVGRKLVQAGLTQLSEKGFDSCLVKTDSPKALQFYLNLNFKKIGEEIRGERNFDLLYYSPKDLQP